MNEEKSTAVAAKKRATSKRKKSKQSAAKIREAASHIKKEDCKLIVDSLVESAKTGKIQSIKLLYNFAHLAEETGEREEALHAPGIALALASSPQWKGDWPGEEKNEDDELDPHPGP